MKSSQQDHFILAELLHSDPATQRKTVIDRSLNDSIGSIVVCEAPKTVEQETIKMAVT